VFSRLKTLTERKETDNSSSKNKHSPTPPSLYTPPPTTTKHTVRDQILSRHLLKPAELCQFTPDKDLAH